MRLVLVLASIVSGLALAAAGCGGDEPSSTSAAADWADGVCSAITTWEGELEQIADRFTDLSSFSEESLNQAANDARDATDTVVDDLRSLGAPDTESGQAARDAVDNLATTVEADLSNIEDTVQSVSGFTEIPTAVATISTSISSMTTAASSTITTIENGDTQGELRDAFEQTDSCSELRRSGTS